jgi:O-antigen ligase
LRHSDGQSIKTRSRLYDSALTRARSSSRKDVPHSSLARAAVVLCAALLIAGLAVTQILIGGRGLVFALPGYALVALAALLAAVTLRRLRSRGDLFCLGASGIFFGYILLRAVTSPIVSAARPDLYCVLAALAVYGVTILLSNATVRLTIIAALLALAIVHVLIGLVQFTREDNFMLIPFLQRANYGYRASGFIVCPNHLAGLLEVLGIFGLSIACWSRWPLWSKLLVGYVAAVCYAGVAMTASRGGYLSVAASLIVFAILGLCVLGAGGRSLVLRFGIAGLAVLIAMLIATAWLFHSSAVLGERAGTIMDPKNMRLYLWSAAIEQWKLQPLTGTGGGTYRYYGRQLRNPKMQGDPIDVHNDYLHLLCEYGAIGAAGFLVFLYAHLRRGLQGFIQFGPRRAARGDSPLSNRLALNIGALCAVAAYIVHSTVDFNLHIPANALLLAFVFGIIANPDLAQTSERSRADGNFLPRIAVALLGAVLLVQGARLFPGEYYAEHARAALRDENPAMAISFAQTALHHEQQNPDIFFYLGRAFRALAHQRKQGEERAPLYNAAVAAFEKARALAPLDGTYPLDIASTYDEMGRFPEAEQMYALARAHDPHSIDVANLYETHLEFWQKATHPAPGPDHEPKG